MFRSWGAIGSPIFAEIEGGRGQNATFLGDFTWNDPGILSPWYGDLICIKKLRKCFALFWCYRPVSRTWSVIWPMSHGELREHYHCTPALGTLQPGVYDIVWRYFVLSQDWTRVDKPAAPDSWQARKRSRDGFGASPLLSHRRLMFREAVLFASAGAGDSSGGQWQEPVAASHTGAGPRAAA